MPPACGGEEPPWPPSLSSGMNSPLGNRNGGWARSSRRPKSTKIARRGIVNGRGAGKGDRPKESARPFSLDGRLSCGSSFLPAPCRFNFAQGLAFSRIGSYMGLWEEEHRAPGANWRAHVAGRQIPSTPWSLSVKLFEPLVISGRQVVPFSKGAGALCPTGKVPVPGPPRRAKPAAVPGRVSDSMPGRKDFGQEKQLHIRRFVAVRAWEPVRPGQCPVAPAAHADV